MGLFSKQTQITSQVEGITDLTTIKDWGVVIALCNAVNGSDDGAKEAGKALRKRLRAGKPQQQMNSITVIQALVDGCGAKFRAQLGTTKFAQDIQGVLISEQTDPNVKIQLMEQLRIWAEAFSQEPGLFVIPQLYANLTRNGRSYRGGQPGSPIRPPPSPEQRKKQMAQDIELARNNASMLIEAVSFADPETEAIEENDLIKEFHQKCLSLQYGIQQYLSDITEQENPDEEWLASLLACNQELVQAFTVYDQMMERQTMTRITKVSVMQDVVPQEQAGVTPATIIPDRHIQDGGAGGVGVGAGLASGFGNGNGNGNGYGNGNGHGNGNGKGVPVSNSHSSFGSATSPTSASSASAVMSVPAVAPVQQPSQGAAADPFADEPYFITGPQDVAAAVKMGKRPDTNQQDNSKVFDASAFFQQQQLEQQRLQLLKDQQRELYEQEEARLAGSSAAPPAVTAGGSSRA